MAGALKLIIAFTVAEFVVASAHGQVSQDAQFVGICVLLAGFIAYKGD